MNTNLSDVNHDALSVYEMIDHQELLSDDDIALLYGAGKTVNDVMTRVEHRFSALGIGIGTRRAGWVHDNLAEEEVDAKPLDQKLYEARDLLTRVLVKADPDDEVLLTGKLKRLNNLVDVEDLD